MGDSYNQSKRQKHELLRAQLEAERSTFISHWRDLGDFYFPRRPRFFVSDVNKGDRRNQKIIDSTGTLAARTLRSGMMSGITSPARPWFRLTTPDPDLAESAKVKDWLDLVVRRMNAVFLRSNLYNVLPMTYGDLGVFATSPMSVEEDIDDTIRCMSFPVGSYMIAKDYRGKINTFLRDFRMTVRQLVDQFGRLDEKGKPDWSVFSTQVKTMWDRSEYETWVDVCHVIQPNEEYNPKKIESKFKKFSSCYYERGIGGQDKSAGSLDSIDGRYLSEKGYDNFPILCPRWEVTGEDVYGTECPGMSALGDVKQLQLGEKRGAQAIEKMVNPPMTAPTQLQNRKISILPGDTTFVDVREGQQGFRAAHEVNLRLMELENKQAQIRDRIKRAFYEDLFLMLANSDRREITAREIDVRQEEKLVALGPVLEQLNQDLLDPLIDNTFDYMIQQDQLPPPPDDIQGVKLRVEYVSVMAQAQKLVSVGSVEKFLGFASSVAQFSPEILDKINTDQAIDIYGDITSVPNGIIRSDDEVDQIRARKAQQQQAQQKLQAIEQGAGAAKQLSETDVSGDNALTRLIQGAGGGQ
jgi:hypothetical protein